MRFPGINFRLIAGAAFLAIAFPFCRPVLAQNLVILNDGATVKLNGKLEVEHQDNKDFLLVKTFQPYLAVFDPKTDQRKVQEVGLSLAGREDELRRHVGQTVWVVGTLQLDGTSPYYYNGTLVLASSVHFASGLTLLPKAETAPGAPSADIIQFHVLVTFHPKPSHFSYIVTGPDGHPLTPSENYSSCGLNGAGDVMNCFCPDGFIFTGSGKMTGSQFIMSEKADMDFAQFEIPENMSGPISKAFECTRK